MAQAPDRDVIRAEIQAIIDAAPARWPIVSDPWDGIEIKQTHQPSPSCAWDVVTARQASGVRKGPAGWSIQAMMGEGDHILGEGLRRLTRQIHRHLRRTARIAALGDDAGADWAHTMHRLPLTAMRMAGVDPVLLLRKDGEHLMQWLEKKIEMTVGTFSIEDGRIDANDLSLDNGELRFVGSGRPALIAHAAVPETVLVALGGRLLSEVVEHPVVQRAGPLRIVEAFSTTGDPPWVTFILEDRQEFIRRPPPGTDRRWNRIPFEPHWVDK